MSMVMSLVLAKPSSVCINLHTISSHSNSLYSSLVLSSRSTFHPLKSFHLHRGSSSLRQGQRTTGVVVRSSIEPVPIPPPTPPPNAASSAPSGFPGRKGWITGIVISLLLPFLKNKWGPLFIFKNYIDQKLQTVEDVVETLEEVADRVDNAAEDFGKSLPEGAFKDAVSRIESVAERIELAAHLTDQSIDRAESSMNAQRIKKFIEENQRLAGECANLDSQCTKLEKECSLYDHDREALMEFGNEADERAKNAEIRVGELEEELKQRSEEVEYYKHQCQLLSVDPPKDGTFMEQKLLNTLVASLLNKGEAVKTASDFLEANKEVETCRELLNMWNSLSSETQNILSLAARVRTLENDKEHLRINLHRAEEEVRVLFEENSVLDEENKRLLRLYKSEKKHASSGGKHGSSAKAKNNKRKTSPVMSSPIDRKIEFDDVDTLRYPLCPLEENSSGLKSHKK